MQDPLGGKPKLKPSFIPNCKNKNINKQKNLSHASVSSPVNGDSQCSSCIDNSQQCPWRTGNPQTGQTGAEARSQWTSPRYSANSWGSSVFVMEHLTALAPDGPWPPSPVHGACSVPPQRRASRQDEWSWFPDSVFCGFTFQVCTLNSSCSFEHTRSYSALNY